MTIRHKLDMTAGRKNETTCPYCGVQAKLINLAGNWRVCFLVDGIWTTRRPECRAAVSKERR